MVVLRRIHAYARHVGDLLVDRSPLGQICPNVMAAIENDPYSPCQIYSRRFNARRRWWRYNAWPFGLRMKPRRMGSVNPGCETRKTSLSIFTTGRTGNALTTRQ